MRNTNATRTTWMVIAASIALSGAALADQPAKAAARTSKGTKPAKMSCEEFLALDEVTRPKVVYWAEGFSRHGKPEGVVVDTEATDRVVPMLVESCQKEPKASFWKKAKAEFKKIF